MRSICTFSNFSTFCPGVISPDGQTNGHQYVMTLWPWQFNCTCGIYRGDRGPPDIEIARSFFRQLRYSSCRNLMTFVFDLLTWSYVLAKKSFKPRQVFNLYDLQAPRWQTDRQTDRGKMDGVQCVRRPTVGEPHNVVSIAISVALDLTRATGDGYCGSSKNSIWLIVLGWTSDLKPFQTRVQWERLRTGHEIIEGRVLASDITAAEPHDAKWWISFRHSTMAHNRPPARPSYLAIVNATKAYKAICANCPLRY